MRPFIKRTIGYRKCLMSLTSQNAKPKGDPKDDVFQLFVLFYLFHFLGVWPFIAFLLSLLGWHWLITLYKLQGYNSIIYHLFTALCTHHSKSSFPSSPCIWPPLRSPSCPTLFPSGNHPLLCPWVYLGFFVVVGSSVAFCFISHILVKSCVSCSFPSNLFHLAWYSQDPSILSQIIVFHPFFWLRSIPLYIWGLSRRTYLAL